MADPGFKRLYVWKFAGEVAKEIPKVGKVPVWYGAEKHEDLLALPHGTDAIKAAEIAHEYFETYYQSPTTPPRPVRVLYVQLSDTEILIPV